MLLFSRGAVGPHLNVRILHLSIVVLLALLFFGQQPAAQSLTFDLFERYLGALREQVGIPGLAAALVQNDDIRWERGFGFADVSQSIRVVPTTAFPLNDLSQTVAAALVLQQCIDSGRAQLDDQLQRWSAGFSDRNATFRQVLSHNGPNGFSYDKNRFAGLTGAIEECAGRPYPLAMVQEVLDKFAMGDSVPGGDVDVTGAPIRLMFPTPKLITYRSILQAKAVPYRVESSRRATPSEYRVPFTNSLNGLVASVHDIARFDAALDDGALAKRRTLDEQAWQPQFGSRMGLGWFVQTVNRKRVVWHFGNAPGAYSSLLVKLPDQRMTLILLANSDGLTGPFPLAAGDIMVSPFARIFFALLG
jgi:CubicO group peptidase (beta-lactamase class C family)